MTTSKCVVITAGAAGIGLSIARAFAAQGARVHICDINEDALQAVTQAQPPITSSVCDLSDRSSVERFVAAAADVDPDDIAALAMFLASDNARLISGQIFSIDGDSQSSQ